MFALRLKRSGGVAVTAQVHRLITRGNRARDRRDWDEAAEAYDQALKAAPELAHIWVQYGHASKERGDPQTARAAYERAATLRPGDADPLLHLGHLATTLGDQRAAGRHYLACFRADPGHADAAMALHRAIATARGRARAELIEVMRSTLGAEQDGIGAEAAVSPGNRDTMVFDVSDLILFYAHGRLATGIQRVQIQTISNAVGAGWDIRLCCFVDGRDEWLGVPLAAFLEVVALGQRGGDRTEPSWIAALHRLHLRLALAPGFVFPQGCTLVNLGSSWQLANYFLFVRAAKAASGIRYVPFVHDLIPIVAPEHFVRGAKIDVVGWILGLFDHADQYLANSEATKRDLLHVAEVLGHQVDPADVTVVPLDADFRKPGAAELSPEALGRWSLQPGGFVLFVATVESRKGHADALEAWSILIARHGAARIPMLVCVGKKGWLAEHVYRRLGNEPALAAKVAMLSGLSDAELALCYRTCLFTLYPSLYEGWGLPVTESLCYGKPVITTNGSSLPEAGGEFAVYVPPGDAAALAAAVERMTFDTGHRTAIEERIATRFRPRSWADIAKQIGGALATGVARHPLARPPPHLVARMGEYHPTGRSRAARIWPGAATGEAFRVGTGWLNPREEGAWTQPEGGELAIGLPAGRDSLRLGLLLVGSPERDIEWRVQVRGGPGRGGSLIRSGARWVMMDCPTPPDHTLRLRIRAVAAEPNPATPDDDEAAVALVGFYVHWKGDTTAAAYLHEAIMLGNLDDIDTYRDRSMEFAGPATGWEGGKISR